MMQSPEVKEEQPAQQSHWARNLKIGAAAVAGGTILAVTGPFLRLPVVLCCVLLNSAGFDRSGCAVLCLDGLCCTLLLSCLSLCCAVLCCAVLCCAVLCCAVLCCAVLCCAVLCCQLGSLYFKACFGGAICAVTVCLLHVLSWTISVQAAEVA